jgi:methyltransferase (TIGR00027 family)
MKATYSRTIEKPQGFLFARWSAGAKAFEYSLPANKRVIEDPYARYYSGVVGSQMVAAMARINPSIRKGIVLRARFFDDYSRQCLQEGFQQVVLLGAGYDSRYLRMPEFRSVPVYELDLESTQTIKKALTRRLLGKLPPNVTYVGIDFSKQSITERLAAAGFNRQLRTLFIWEGVTLFLNQEIICETLGRLAELRPGNRVIFDFIPPELIDDETDYRGNRQLLHLCASINEPLTFGCDPARMKALLPTLGFKDVNITSMREANLRYSGTDRIEDSYYFTTAESGSGNGRLVDHNGEEIS